MFEGVAIQSGAEWQSSLENIDEAVRDPAFLRRFQAEKPDLHALIRNTCSITMLQGSEKINVVPPLASAELDCRILPDQNAAEFLDGIRERIADDQIRIDEIMLFSAAQSSPDTDLFRLLESVTQRHFPGTRIVHAVSAGFTDSHFFRDNGVASYGYSPFVIPEEDYPGVHGNNESIRIDTFDQGIEIMTEIVRDFAVRDGTR
jgi:acetylornithine deacetylase/succinyl-diaminopimelate desuccinylase-like protein